MTMYMKKWTVLQDGGSSTWLYVANVGRMFVFIEIMDVPDMCGKDAHCLWEATVSIVDMEKVTQEQLDEAIRSCGWEGMWGTVKPKYSDLIAAEVLHSYGSKAPCWSDCSGEVSFDKYGNVNESYSENSMSFRTLRAEARREAEQLLKDESYRKQRLGRVVNKLGQTAEEFATGTSGLWNRLRTIAEEPEKATDEQKLMLKGYQRAGQTLGVGPVPQDIMDKAGDMNLSLNKEG